MRTHYCGQVGESSIGQTVTVAGWAHRRRDHGGVIFVDLRDREGLLQIVFNPDTADVFAKAERVRNEYVLQVTGVVRARPPGTVNPNLKSGQVELVCRSLDILNRSEPSAVSIGRARQRGSAAALPIHRSAPGGDAGALDAPAPNHPGHAPVSG